MERLSAVDRLIELSTATQKAMTRAMGRRSAWLRAAWASTVSMAAMRTWLASPPVVAKSIGVRKAPMKMSTARSGMVEDGMVHAPPPG
jgi:hypothetical protein